jgi:WD40 repeat protein/tRNA A-37 threonylcarbamoyl transferase component Bud32
VRPAETSVLPEPPATDGTATNVVPPFPFSALLVPNPSGANWPRVRGYEILSLIGSGGMGVVYKARHRDLCRTVALKVLRGEALADPEFRERFRVEAEAVARLQHPNVIQVFEIGTVDPRAGEPHPSPFISLEFVEGGSLTRLTGRPQPPRYAAEMVEKLARAVQSAHRLGVVHRDLKPANVLLTDEGEPKVADFGVAKQLGTERDAGGRFLTQAGTVVGTPEYMAPEQAAGGPPTTAVDLYALGVILYELLTARVPFHAASPLETMSLLQSQEPVSPRRLQPGLPRDLETVCLKCLEKDPGKRYATAEALADDLRRFLDNRPIRARRVTEVERLARWCRRNPLVAASLAGVAGMFLAAFALVWRSYWHAEAAWREEATQRQEAQRREKAERWERYRANLVAAAGALQVYDVGSARRTLEDAPEEYRDWEWRHFESRLDLAQLVLRCDGGAAKLTPDGRRVALFGDGDLARVWDTTDPKEVWAFRNAPELRAAVLSPDGKTFAYITPGHTVTLRDADADRVRAVLRGHGDTIHTINFSADGSRVLTAAQDRTVRIWDAATGHALRVFRPYESGVAATGLSPDGRRFVTSDHDRHDAQLWDIETGSEVAALPGHAAGVQGMHFNRHGDAFVTVEMFPGNEIRMWDTGTGRPLGSMRGHGNTVMKVAFSADGARIASGSMDQTVRLWDGATGEPVATLKGHSGRVISVAFSPDGRQLASAAQDHTVRLWDATAGAPVAVLNGHTGPVVAVTYAPDGRIVSAAEDGTVRLWDPRRAGGNGVLRGHTSFVYSVAFHPDGERVATAGWDGTVRIWDATTGRQMSLLNHGANTLVTSVAFHPDGRLLAARVRGSIVLWDLESGRELHRWAAPSHPWQDTRLAFSPRGDLLATGCGDGEVRLWDVVSRAEVAVLRGHRAAIRDVAFSPDGQWLASAGEVEDSTVRIWDVARKEQVRALEGHKECVYALAFSPDGRQLASGSVDGTARLWDTATGQAVATLKHGSNVYGVAFTPDGTRLACGCADNSIRFWDVATRQSVAELRGHTDYVHALAFSPDGTRLVSASGDYTARVWDTVRPQDRARGR